MSHLPAIHQADITYACRAIALNPGRYGQKALRACLATTTQERYAQRRLAAGRKAITDALFVLVPALKGDHRRLTAAIRRGTILDGGTEPNWAAINEQGAKALNIPTEVPENRQQSA